MIQIENVSKTYKVYPNKSARLKEWASLRTKTYHSEYQALKNLSLQIESGEVFGVIGLNGAGKSTLLKILTGTTHPTQGELHMHGRVAALLELGTGFHPDLTGRENIHINGKLIGLTDDEIVEKISSIQEFSELGNFFDEPVRTYSSGMYVRLGFALAVAVDPQILIIDEALSVGDAYFQQKCVKKLREFKDKGVTIVFVSHDMGIVTSLCDRVALLDQGELCFMGTALDTIEMYNALLARQSPDAKKQRFELRPPEKNRGTSSGNLKATVEMVRILDDSQNAVESIVAGQLSHIQIDVRFADQVSNPTVGILIRDRLGIDVFGTNSAHLLQQTGVFSKGDQRRFQFSCKMNLGPGKYTLSVAVHSETTHVDECYQWIDRIASFEILPRADYNFLGLSMLEPTFSSESVVS